MRCIRCSTVRSPRSSRIGRRCPCRSRGRCRASGSGRSSIAHYFSVPCFFVFLHFVDRLLVAGFVAGAGLLMPTAGTTVAFAASPTRPAISTVAKVILISCIIPRNQKPRIYIGGSGRLCKNRALTLCLSLPTIFLSNGTLETAGRPSSREPPAPSPSALRPGIFRSAP